MNLKERPILFSGPMVRAILDGSKTMTRRVVKPRIVPIVDECFRVNGKWCNHTFGYELGELCPYGQPGDRLWVRETWATVRSSHGNAECFCYRADDPTSALPVKYKPSIHMPRAASRIAMEVVGVKVERVQDITHEDAIREGCHPHPLQSSQSIHGDFERLWDSINAKRGYGWDVNPWVWAITFRRIQP